MIHTEINTCTSAQMNEIEMGLKFRFKSCETVWGGGGGGFLRESGSEFQTVGPKTEKDLFPKVSREK